MKRLLPILLLALMPSPATASFPGDNGRLAITSDFGCDGSWIQTIRPDGSGRRALTPRCGGDDRYHDAAWSSDGRSLFFKGGFDDESNCCVSVMRADGSAVERLFDTDSVETGPQPEPGAARLVFEGGSPPSAVFLANRDGSGLTRLATGTIPRFSPDGKKIAFVGPERDAQGDPARAKRGLWLMRPNGEILRRVTGARIEAFDWSPNGRRLVFAGVNRERAIARVSMKPGLYTVHARTGELGRLLAPRRSRTVPPRAGVFAPAWSPDGRWIAFVRARQHRQEGPFGTDNGTRQVQKIRPSGGRARFVFQIRDNRTSTGPLWRTTLSWQARP